MSIWPSKCDPTFAMTLVCYLVVTQDQFTLRCINRKIAIPFTWWRNSQSYNPWYKCECGRSSFTSNQYLFLESLFECQHFLIGLMVSNSQNDFNVAFLWVPWKDTYTYHLQVQSKCDAKSSNSINPKLNRVQSVINLYESSRVATLTCKKLWGIQENEVY